MKKVVLILVILSCWCPSHVWSLGFVTEGMILKAAKEMTPDEASRTKRYLQEHIAVAKAADDRVKQTQLEEVLNEFNKGHYNLVMQGLRVLGENPQEILRITELRDRLLSGQLELAPLLAREIASIDWLFEHDAQEAKKQWPHPKNKLLYLMDLVGQLAKDQERITDVSLLEDTTDDLKGRLEELKTAMPNILKRDIEEAVRKLNAIFQCRILNKEIQCATYLGGLK